MLKIFYTITAFQLLFFGLVVITSKQKKQFHYWMSALLFTLFIVLALIVFRWHYNIIPDNLLFKFLTILFEYGIIPLFYFFVVKVTQQKVQLKPKMLFLTIPFGIAVVFLFLPQTLWDKNWLMFHTLLTFNFYGQAILFFLLALKRYQAYQLQMKNYLTQDYLQRLKILKLALTGFLIILVLGLIGNVIRIQLKFEASIMNQAVEMIILLLINIILFVGIKLPQELIDISFDEKEDSIDSIDNEKYKNSSLSSADKKVIVEKLNRIVAQNKYYKTPNLTIKKLSQELDVQSKHLSQVINENFEQNFCDYVNTLRINDAIHQLKDQKQKHKTILEICYSVGFNSKSAFNDVFRKQTGLTPTACRKSFEHKK